MTPRPADYEAGALALREEAAQTHDHDHCNHTVEDHERMGWTCDMWPEHRCPRCRKSVSTPLPTPEAGEVRQKCWGCCHKPNDCKWGGEGPCGEYCGRPSSVCSGCGGPPASQDPHETKSFQHVGHCPVYHGPKRADAERRVIEAARAILDHAESTLRDPHSAKAMWSRAIIERLRPPFDALRAAQAPPKEVPRA